MEFPGEGWLGRYLDCHSMFPAIKEHYSAISKDWTARDWATAIADDAPDRPERIALREAMVRMLHHDKSRGLVGSIVDSVAKKLHKHA